MREREISESARRMDAEGGVETRCQGYFLKLGHERIRVVRRRRAEGEALLEGMRDLLREWTPRGSGDTLPGLLLELEVGPRTHQS